MKPWKPGTKPCGHYDTHEFDGTCYDCWKAKSPGELLMAKIVRCPKCGHSWEPCFETAGREDQWCSQCDHNFEVEVYIDTSYTSPPLEQRK